MCLGCKQVGSEASPATQEAAAAAAFELMDYYALPSEDVPVNMVEEAELKAQGPQAEGYQR